MTDHHNTATAMVRDSDLAAERERTAPFGEQRGAAPAWWAGDKGFLGGTVDPAGLVHLGARLYDPGIGRFISVDPIMDLADPQQMHGYAYANSNPTTWSDPSGLYLCADNGCNDPRKPDGKRLGKRPVDRSINVTEHTRLTFTDGKVYLNGYLLPEGSPNAIRLAHAVEANADLYLDPTIDDNFLSVNDTIQRKHSAVARRVIANAG